MFLRQNGLFRNGCLIFALLLCLWTQLVAQYLESSPGGVRNFYFVILNQGSFESSWFDPLLRHVHSTPREPFFDSFLFNCTSVEHPLPQNPNNRHGLWAYKDSKPDTFQAFSELSDWNTYLDILFTTDTGTKNEKQNLFGLNEIAARFDQPVKIIVTIPYPDPRQTDFGNPTSDSYSWNFSDTSNTDRFNASAWFIEEVQERWTEASFSHLKLVGFYWINEDDQSWGTAAAWGSGHHIAEREKALVRRVARRLHAYNYEFYTIPGASKGAPAYIQGDPDDLFDRIDGYGYDVVCLQPGISHYDNDYYRHAQYCARKGYGVYIECLTQYDGWLRTFTEGLDAGILLDHQDNSMHGYWFWPSISLTPYLNSSLGWQKAIYEKVFRFATGQYNRLGYACDVGELDKEDNPRDYDGDGITDDQDIDLHTSGVCLLPGDWQAVEIDENSSTFRKSVSNSGKIVLNYPNPEKEYAITLRIKNSGPDVCNFTQLGKNKQALVLGEVKPNNEWQRVTFIAQPPYFDSKQFYSGENFENVFFEFSGPVSLDEIRAVPIDVETFMYHLDLTR